MFSRVRGLAGSRLAAVVLVFAALGLVLAGAPAAPAPARTPWTSGRVLGSPYPPPPYAVERLHPARSFRQPVDLAFIPGTERLVVAEQGGRLWSFDTRDGGTNLDLALDVRAHHRPLDNVLGFTFHPGFATNRFVFINYNEPPGRAAGAVVARFTLAPGEPWRIDPASEKGILRWLSGGHNGCTLTFGNDGFLYISTGDADDPDPPDGKRRTGQDVSDLLASVLRIDVDRTEGTNAYAIPADNPFVGRPGVRPEIWAFGFRNPWRMSFDRPTGDLWVGDVGWEQWEMVYRVQRGGNYGWSITEGPNPRVRFDVTPGPGPILPPLHAVPHSDGASITGGYVYRGTRLPGLRGAYVYGDWETGRFWALRSEGDRLLSNEELCDTALKPISFTLDARGELLVLDYNGGLYRFVTNQAPPASRDFPRRLSESGLFTALNPLTPAPGTVPYRPVAPMWNDQAEAEWLMAVPGQEAIATAGGVGNIAGGTWFYPSNTVLARTLSLELNAGDARSRRRIETQLLHWDGQGWNPYSYRWRADGAEADLVSATGAQDTFAVRDAAAPGGMRQVPWRFHSRAECLRCHNAWAGEALTLNWLQLGAPAAGAAGREFDRLAALGVLRARDLSRGTTLVDPHDVSAPLAARARSWLHVNCGTCHRFGAGGAVSMHLNYDKPIKDLRVLDVVPTRGDFGLAKARLVSTEAPEASTLLYRLSTEGVGHMPHIGSRLVDERGMALIRDWLVSLRPAGAPEPASPATDVAGVLADTRSALRWLTAAGVRTNPPGIEDVAAAAAGHTNVFIRELFQRWLPPAQRRSTLGSEFDPGTVLGLGGDAARGRALFQGVAQCARCHVRDGTGRAFGPSLDGVGTRWTRAQLLEEIVHPSRTIAPEYRSTTVTLRDGSELTGFVLQRTPGELRLRDEQLVEHRLAGSTIQETRSSALSAMPEGLLAPLTAAEAADLLEYLAAPAQPR